MTKTKLSLFPIRSSRSEEVVTKHFVVGRVPDQLYAVCTVTTLYVQ